MRHFKTTDRVLVFAQPKADAQSIGALESGASFESDGKEYETQSKGANASALVFISAKTKECIGFVLKVKTEESNSKE